MTSTALPLASAAALRAALRRHAGTWIARFYRHELLVARSVRGVQVEAVEAFRREVIEPVLRRVGAGLSLFDARGQDVVIEANPALRAIVRDVEAIVAKGVGRVEILTNDRLGAIVEQEADWVRDSAKKVLRIEPPAIDLGKLQRAVVERPYLGAKVEGWFRTLVSADNGANDNVRSTIQTGLQRGWSTDEIVRALRGRRETNYTDGLLSGENVRHVRALVQTAATHATATARGEAFKAIGVERWRFVATLDERTSIQCAANDGKTFPIGEGPLPPLHPNCRSATVPDFGDPEGTRASMGGQVPADLTFREWLEGQPIGVQNEVLGVTKAMAWRAGDLTIDQMLGSDLQPLTLAELRRLDRIPDDDE